VNSSCIEELFTGFDLSVFV